VTKYTRLFFLTSWTAGLTVSSRSIGSPLPRVLPVPFRLHIAGLLPAASRMEPLMVLLRVRRIPSFFPLFFLYTDTTGHRITYFQFFCVVPGIFLSSPWAFSWTNLAGAHFRLALYSVFTDSPVSCYKSCRFSSFFSVQERLPHRPQTRGTSWPRILGVGTHFTRQTTSRRSFAPSHANLKDTYPGVHSLSSDFLFSILRTPCEPFPYSYT